MTELLDDGSAGELIEEPRMTLGESEIRPGDRVIFRYRHRAFPNGQTELAGLVVYVLPGFQLTYIVKVMGAIRWPDLFVDRRDVLKVVV